MSKKSIHQYTIEDSKRLNTIIGEFSTCYPNELDDALERLKESLSHPQTEPGLTPLEFILRKLEDAARSILDQKGYPTDPKELKSLDSDHSSLVALKHGGTAIQCDVDLRSLSAKKVLLSAIALREFIKTGNAEQAATEMMRLLFAAVNIDMYEIIMTGTRAKGRQSRGGKVSAKRLGIIEAIKEVIKNKGDHLSREQIWRYFKNNHNLADGQNEMIIRGYEIYFDEFEAAKKYKNKLAQKDLSTEKVSTITKSTFFRYVTEIRRKKIAQ